MLVNMGPECQSGELTPPDFPAVFTVVLWDRKLVSVILCGLTMILTYGIYHISQYIKCLYGGLLLIFELYLLEVIMYLANEGLSEFNRIY